MTKQQYDKYKEIGIVHVEPEQIIEKLANRLLKSLYKPVKDERQWVADPPDSIRDEPINWGDLSATVEKVGEGYLVTIEECAPDDCPELCAYIEKHLDAWSWINVTVKTEW